MPECIGNQKIVSEKQFVKLVIDILISTAGLLRFLRPPTQKSRIFGMIIIMGLYKNKKTIYDLSVVP